MTNISEGKVHDNKIYLNGYFRATIIGFAGFVIFGFSALTKAMVDNDVKYIEKIEVINDKVAEDKADIASIKAKLDSIKEGLTEIKALLRPNVKTSN